ncbi:MAG: hypothetical protein R2865_15980 [Deinococcales bacterium]
MPLGARYITKNILEAGFGQQRIYLVGIGMLLLILIYALCNSFVDYQGHMMGSKDGKG